MRGSPTPRDEPQNPTDGTRPAQVVRRVTEFPGVTATPTRPGPRNVNDGVFANLAAKPERGEKVEEQPPVSFTAILDPFFILLIFHPDLRTSRR